MSEWKESGFGALIWQYLGTSRPVHLRTGKRNQHAALDADRVAVAKHQLAREKHLPVRNFSQAGLGYSRISVDAKPLSSRWFCRTSATSKLGAHWPARAVRVPPSEACAHYELISLSAPAAVWEQADTSWLDSLYAVGQQADRLVQLQLTGINELQPPFISDAFVPKAQLICRCNPSYIRGSAGGRVADESVSLHIECLAPDYWLYRWILS